MSKAMSDDLGARLVQAGLVTREELADALGLGAQHGGSLAAALVLGGLDEQALAGFFLSEGFGPLFREDELQHADEGLAARVPEHVAQALLALPVRSTAAGVVVAMADPTDRHAVQELARILTAAIVPGVARVTDLRGELARRKVQAATPPLDDEEEEPLELIKKRAPTVPGKDGDYAGSTTGAERERARASSRPVIEIGDADEPPVPLVRTKPFPTPGVGVGRLTPARGSPLARAIATSAVPPPADPSEGAAPMIAPRERERERVQTRDQIAIQSPESTSDAPSSEPEAPEPPSPAVEHDLEQPPAHAEGPPPALPESEPGPTIPRPPPTPAEATAREDRWGDLARPPTTPPASWSKPDKTGRAIAKVATTRIARRRGVATEVGPASPPMGEIGSILSGIRASNDRDEAVGLACEGALTVARSCVFLVLRKGVLRGREAVGAGTSREAIRNLWIPATSPSVFRDVVQNSVAYSGPYGTAAADAVFRAAVASRGGELLAQPVVVSGKVVGLLCADDVRHADLGRARIEALAHAVGDAFERIIVAGKSA